MRVAANRAAQLRRTFDESGLTGVFVEELGWESPTSTSVSVDLDGETLQPSLISSLKGFRIYAVAVRERPTRQQMRRVDAQLAQMSPERLEVFTSPDAWYWHWPRRTSAGTTTFESVETLPDVLPTFLAQRLTGLEFTIADHRKGVTLADVRDRVHGNFDASPVTKKFYTRFADEQARLAVAIEGLPDDDRYRYSTTLLNRLMFIYFMQKKEFLNGDPRYLENTLAAVQKLKGQDRYYSFYRDALLPLFFEKLNERTGVVQDPEIARILGDVPYVNGGIFGRTDLEDEFEGELGVPDAAFERILAFFGEFNWHLDTRPTGNPDEINPEVIGYIFEQFINVASSGKKENGAYYTPHDVTGYMVAQTLIPRILDDFSQLESVFERLRADPDRYIQPALLHGWDAADGEWAAVPEAFQAAWEGDPSGWSVLDTGDVDPGINLPGETWVETFHRRERVGTLRRRIEEGEITQVNDLVTENLNGQLLLTDAIDGLDDGAAVATLFGQVSALSVFDPTCGSGAFLFAALEVLEDVYDHLIDEARSCHEDPAVDDLLRQVDVQPNKRYFIRKHIAIRNLYGTDLMPGAIETAKLRVFLALAACVETRAELQPLPDLDFNLKAGNLVVGFKDSSDVGRIGADLFTSAQLAALQPKIDDYAATYSRFVAAVESNAESVGTLKSELRELERSLRVECDGLYAEQSRVPAGKFDEWVEASRPFHWFCEFPEVIRRGGFDVIIGNPPYVRMTQLPGYTVVGYRANRSPDLFAVCYERSLSLLSPRGRHAFIVMAALSISEDYRALREVIAEREGAEWWSTFGRIPAGLFPGNVRVRNTLLVLGPGNASWATRHHLHKTVQRGWLFPSIEYAGIRRVEGDWPVRGGVASSILQRLAELPPVAGAQGSEIVHVRPTAAYWMPVLPGPAPVLDGEGHVLNEVDPRLKRIQLRVSERAADVVAIASGKIAYLWWVLIGDDFDVNSRELDVPRALALTARSSSGWSEGVKAARQAARRATFLSVNAGKYYFNVRWTALRAETDPIDRLALAALGGDDRDWHALNVLYRQVMRSSGDSAKGRYVTDEEYSTMLDWDYD